jgi:hypothetical protein
MNIKEITNLVKIDSWEYSKIIFTIEESPNVKFEYHNYENDPSKDKIASLPMGLSQMERDAITENLNKEIITIKRELLARINNHFASSKLINKSDIWEG